MAREKGEIKNQRRFYDASYNSVKAVSSIHDDKIIVRTTGRETSTRINNIYDILEELKEKLPLACKKHLLDYSSNSTIIDDLVIKALSNSHLFGLLLPDDIKRYAPKLNGDPSSLDYQIANSYYDFFVEPLVESDFTAKTVDMASVYGLEIRIKNMLNSKRMTENISEFIELFHEYIKICDRNNISSYWLRGDSLEGLEPDLTGKRFNEEVFKRVYSSIGKKKAILTSKITDEYELLFYWLVDKLNIENKMLRLIKSNINGYIDNEMRKDDLEEFNYLYGKKIKFEKEKLKKGIEASIERVQTSVTNMYQNEYHTIFYHIASKINLQEGIPINEAINHVVNYIDSHFSDTRLKYLNKRYNMDVSYNIEEIKTNIRMIPEQISGDKYIPKDEYLSKNVLEATKFFRNIDRFNEDVFKHYRLNCNLNMSKSDRLAMLSNYDIPMIFDQVLKKFNYRMTKGNGLCFVKKERDSRGIVTEKEIKISINLLKCNDKINSFFKLPQTTDCLGYFSMLKVKFPFVSKLEYGSILNASKDFWKIVTSTQLPMAHALMFGDSESDKTMLYFDCVENDENKNNQNKKLSDEKLGKFYLQELRSNGKLNCFSMINNVSIDIDEKGNYIDSLYFSGNARCMIGVREKSKKQSIWFQVENQKQLKEKATFLKKIERKELELDFAFLKKQSIFKYYKGDVDTLTILNRSLVEDMNQGDSASFYKKIEKLKNSKYSIYWIRYNQLMNLNRCLEKELKYHSKDRESNRKNIYFNVNEIFGLNFNDREKEIVLNFIKKEVDRQLYYAETFQTLENYFFNADNDINAKFFVQLTNLYKTLIYDCSGTKRSCKNGDSYEKNIGIIHDITDDLLKYYDKLDYNPNFSTSLERNLPIIAYPAIVAKLCELYHIENVKPEEIIGLKPFMDFIKMSKSKINNDIVVKH